jgi:Fe-S oxidoreductase
MKQDGARKMRAIAEEACALVKRYKGAAFSGEHGDGLVRSEWIEPILGARLTGALERVKTLFDPHGLMNPGKIVHPSRMDDATLFRYPPGYATRITDTALDWSEWGGFAGAVEMCNNNGHCRKFDAGTMCPSYRATREEQHLTRGRANSLRLALSGQLGPDALASKEMYETLDLCVSCKGCKRECPTGVDMARMKIEFLHHYHRAHGYSLLDRLIAFLPRYAPWAARLAPLSNLREYMPGLKPLAEAWLGLSAKRSLPKWRRDVFTASHVDGPHADTGREVAVFADTFNNYFEPENLRAAVRVFEAARYRVHVLRPTGGGRPLCCGRTFLSVGMVEQARAEARRLLDAALPLAERGVACVGLEPACLFSLRDEYAILGLDAAAVGAVANQAFLFETFVARESEAGRFHIDWQRLPAQRALLHGHCHQKAFAVVADVQRTLGLLPNLHVDLVPSSCCGMAGAFGYEAAHFDASMRMAEAGLLPAVRQHPANSTVLADGTSCRHQLHDGTGRQAMHVARFMEQALPR